MARLSLVPPSTSIDVEAQRDKFWLTMAEAAAIAIAAVHPLHPDASEMRTFVIGCQAAAGIRPLTGVVTPADKGA